MLLWLDDKRSAPPGWTWAKTADEAATILMSRDVLYASLDHDLGRGQATGFDLVTWMAKNNRWPRYRPGIHSANPIGATRMVMGINAWGPYE